MRKLMMICAAALAVCGAAGALTFNDRMKVHFDQPVIAGETVLPAGDCTIQMLDPADNTSSVLLIRSESGVQTMVLTNRLSLNDSAKGAKITIIREGDAYRLNRVWLSETEGFELLDTAK
jgi:hypothetical protein